MKLPVLIMATASALGLTMTAPSEALAAKVNVDIHLGLPVVPHVVHTPRIIYAPAVVHRSYVYRHPDYHRHYYHRHGRPHYHQHRGYAADQWDHGYYDQRSGKHR